MDEKLSVADVDVREKRVLMRVDFNVPLTAEGKVADATRIEAALPTIRYLLEKRAKLVLMSHLGRPKGKRVEELTLRPVAEELGRRLDRKIAFLPEVVGESAWAAVSGLAPGEAALLENLRFYPGEEANDEEFARELARLGEVYVNDAFGTAHRAHASTVGVTRYLPSSCAGFLMEKELRYLGGLMKEPARPFAAVLGGAKISGKIEVIQNLMRTVDYLLVGGGMCFTFLKAKGHDIGKSIVEEDKIALAHEILREAEGKVEFVLPTDVVISESPKEPVRMRQVGVDSIPGDMCGVDIGPQSGRSFAERLQKCRTIFWNGPMGIFEVPEFSEGTVRLAEAIARATDAGATSVVGGGDSVAAVTKAGVEKRISHISTGGGASLEFIEGKELPGVAALANKPGVRNGT